MMRRALLGGIAALVGGTAWQNGVFDPVVNPEDAAADVTDTAAVNAAFLDRYNAMRADRGLPEATQSDTLTDMASAHAEHMADHEYLAHEQPDGTTIEDRYLDRGLLPGCRLPAAGDRYYNGAENVAGAAVGRVRHPGSDETYTIYNADDLARFLFDSWMRSDSHRRVMTLPAVRRIGLGVGRTGDDLYAAVEFC